MAIARILALDPTIVVAIGHTDGDEDATRAAVDAGARVATHLWPAAP